MSTEYRNYPSGKRLIGNGIPTAPGDWGINDVLIVVHDGKQQNQTYNLIIYGEGRYNLGVVDDVDGGWMVVYNVVFNEQEWLVSESDLPIW